MQFNREKYYSITDVLKKYLISSKQYKELIKDLPKVGREADLGIFKVNAVYVLREDIEGLNLTLRIPNVDN